MEIRKLIKQKFSCRRANSLDAMKISYLYKNYAEESPLRYDERDFHLLSSSGPRNYLLVAYRKLDILGYLVAYDQITFGFIDFIGFEEDIVVRKLIKYLIHLRSPIWKNIKIYSSETTSPILTHLGFKTGQTATSHYWYKELSYGRNADSKVISEST